MAVHDVVNIVVLADGTVDKTVSLVSRSATATLDKHPFNGMQIGKAAERVFLDECKRIDPTFKNLTPDDIEAILDDGYYECDEADGYRGKVTICLGWASQVYT